jgi:hypothetical protein
MATTMSTTTTSTSTTSQSSSESTAADGCGGIHEGNLQIDATTDLAAVEQITTINGNLDITGVASTDLAFLRCLEEVVGDVGIWENPELQDLSGAERLSTIRPGDQAGEGTGSLRIVSNPKLRTLSGLDGLTTTHSMLLSDNAVLDSIGLPALLRVENGLRLGGCSSGASGAPAVGSGSNPMLTAFDGVDSLEYVGGLFIYGQEHLASLARLRELAEGGTDFAGYLEAGVNPELASSEIESFVAAAAITRLVACQNKDDTEVCSCPPD